MKALVKLDVGEGKVSIKDVDEPQITRDDEVKIKVKAAGICGTDVKILHGKDALFRPPVIMGHEFTGQIMDVGDRVKKLKIGDRVVFEPTVSICGECRYCRSGRYNLCSNRLIAGFSAPGGFAEYAVRRQKYTHKLPDKVSYAAGALCEPLAVCTHAVLELTLIFPGDTVVVMGPGTIGLLSLQLVKVSGACPIVIGASKDKPRLDLAKRLGAEYTINIEEEKETLSRITKDLTEGCGADVVIGCCGAPSSLRLGIDMLRKGGRYTQIGLFTQEVSFPVDKMSYHELTLQGSFGQKNSAWKKALTLLGKGLVDTLPLASSLPMSRWQEGFKMVENKEAIKVVLQPEA